MTEEQLEEIKYEGLKAMCRKYIKVLREENPDADWKNWVTWREEYEDMEMSHNLQGASVGIWLGMPGDQRWDNWQWFSVSTSSEWE